MAKAHIFKRRDANRFRKVYNYIRRKPVDQFVSSTGFKMIVGDVDFSNTSGPVTFTYKTANPTITFSNVPIVTALSVDNLSNSSANVNIFITSVTTTQVTFESSAPFNGKVNFQVVSQD
tara:strand:- start:91 stop:447 length:357 start_codon:yes stop_codon:yes gene_type:complete